MTYDLFICHASEDKDTLARDLATSLRASGLTVWYDEFSLILGDSLRQKIDQGLANSRFGVVVLSPDFFAKRWTQWELNGLVAKEMAEDRKIILPVWHQVLAKDVRQYSPALADRLAISTTLGVQSVAKAIQRAVFAGDAETYSPREKRPKMAVRIPTRKERAEYYFYGHVIRVQGDVGAVDTFIRSVDEKQEIFNLTKSVEEGDFEVQFRTLDCIEKDQLEELAKGAGLKVTKNHLWMNA